ncbi:MAG TPA: DUF3300 domain-containing protein [Pseudomonadales bacterium]|nr:DUF3300 domain-containing protein [Pseudomonadales bacterium]
MKISRRDCGWLELISTWSRAAAIATIIVVGLTLRVSAQDQSVPPPSAPAQLSEADLEKIAQPIALYPDPILAVMLPASVYPLEVVQAARFVQDTNNIAQLDSQPWDSNVIAVAKYPTVIQKMNDDLQWTIQLGNAFADQPADLMTAIQTLRAKAQAAGTLKSSPEQVVTVTNAVVERYYDTQIVYVTNTVVEIQPANPQIVYVPVYNPTYVYYPPPGYVYTPVYVSFRIVVTPYRCNWYYGGIYVGGGGGMVIWGGRGPYHPPYYPCPPGYRPPYYRPPPGYRPPPPGYRPPGYPPPRPPGSYPPPGNRPPGGGNPPPGGRPGGPTTMPANDAPWKPDPNRRQNAGSGGLGNNNAARGWGSGGPSSRPAAPGTGNTGNRPSTGDIGNRPNTGTSPGNPNIGNRPATPPGNGNTGNRPNYGNGGNNSSPGTMPSNNRPAPAPNNQPATPNRPAPSNPSAGNRPAQQPGGGSQNSAFGGVGNGNDARSSSNRGAASRGGGGGGGRPAGGGGGARGGGR